MADIQEYLLRIAKRIAELEVRAGQLNTSIDGTNDAIGDGRHEFRDRLDALHEEVDTVRSELDELEETIEVLINRFKRTARADQLNRLDDKLDEWSPEDLVTYEQVRERLQREHDT